MDLRTLSPDETISGFFFVASPAELEVMDIMVGPTRPMMPGKRGGRRLMERDCSIPHRYHPWFLDTMVSEIAPITRDLRLELIASDGTVALYRFPPPATDVLSEWIPGRSDFVHAELALLTERIWSHPTVQVGYKESGVSGAILTVRGGALKAVPRGGDKNLYYWCYRTADAGRLRSL